MFPGIKIEMKSYLLNEMAISKRCKISLNHCGNLMSTTVCIFFVDVFFFFFFLYVSDFIFFSKQLVSLCFCWVIDSLNNGSNICKECFCLPTTTRSLYVTILLKWRFFHLKSVRYICIRLYILNFLFFISSCCILHIMLNHKKIYFLAT